MKLLSVKIETPIDDFFDTSFLGEYTNKAEEWNICCHCGQYVNVAERYNRIADAIDDDMTELGNEIRHREYDNEYGTGDYDRQCAVYDAMEAALARVTNRKHNCLYSPFEYNYFKPYASGEVRGTKDYEKCGLQDFKRMESFNSGQWSFIGVIAKAEVEINDTIQTIQSSGMWGVESDCEFDDYKDEQLDNLKVILAEMGVDLSEWKGLKP